MSASEGMRPRGAARFFVAEDDPRNWQEDYPHDNGMYSNVCSKCDRVFFGYKRRLVCKECFGKESSDGE